jgi:nitrate/TMAO reductase-like tetraheme cytochrome c subunit
MRNIRDEYELPDDDSDENVGSLLRKRQVNIGAWAVGLVLFALFIAGIYGIMRIDRERSNDSFCTGCHTIPEKTYSDRADSAMAGALAADLASYHYQQIHGQGGTVNCMDCHQGTSDFRSHLDVTLISARNGFDWLIARNDPKIEKLHLQSPQLANDSCVTCHEKTLLLAGMNNHYHNMLPVAYELWRNGGRLIAPTGATDVQTIIAAGLVKYDTTLGCSDCHQAHRNIETDLYFDRDTVLPAMCVQCHRDVGKGPLEVSFPASQ